MRNPLARAGRGLARIEELLSKVLLALLVLLVFVPAVTRTFNRPIIWSIEIAQLLFAWLAFLGANQAMRADAHIGVDVLTRHLPPRPRQVVALFNLALIAAFLAALLWYGLELTFVSVDRRFMTTNLSFAFATAAAPLGAALLLLTTIGKLFEILRSGPDPGPDPDPGAGAAGGRRAGREAADTAPDAGAGDPGPDAEAAAGRDPPSTGEAAGRDGAPHGDGARPPESPLPPAAAAPPGVRGPAKPPTGKTGA